MGIQDKVLKGDAGNHSHSSASPSNKNPDPLHFDRGAAWHIGKWHLGAGDHVVKRSEFFRTLKANGFTKEDISNLKEDVNVPRSMSIAEANQYYASITAWRDFKQTGQFREIPLDPRLTSKDSHAADLPFQPAPGESDGHYINRLNNAFHHGDNGKKVTLLGISGSHDGIFEPAEIIAAKEKAENKHLSKDEKKRIENEFPEFGLNGLNIEKTLQSVARDLENNAALKPTELASNAMPVRAK